MTVSPLFCYRMSAIAEFSFCGNCICIIVFLCSFKPTPSVLAPFFPRPFDSLLCACLPLFRSPTFQRPHPYLPCLSLSSFLGLLASLSLFASLLFFFCSCLHLFEGAAASSVAATTADSSTCPFCSLHSIVFSHFSPKRCLRQQADVQPQRMIGWLGYGLQWQEIAITDLFCAVHPIFSFGFHQNTETKKTEEA